MEIKLGVLVFKTKKSITEYVYSLFREKKIGFIVRPGDDLFNFFFDLLKRHPEFDDKTKHGLEFFRFGSNPLHASIELQVVGLGGKYEPFAWKEAVSGKVKKDNKLREAMRNAIESQIDYFRNRTKKPSVCEVCKCKKSYFHVDHLVKFRDLSADFLKDYEAPVEFDRTRTFTWVFKSCDSSFNQAWQKYHSDHAQLRWICAECNLKAQ